MNRGCEFHDLGKIATPLSARLMVLVDVIAAFMGVQDRFRSIAAKWEDQ